MVPESRPMSSWWGISILLMVNISCSVGSMTPTSQKVISPRKFVANRATWICRSGVVLLNVYIPSNNEKAVTWDVTSVSGMFAPSGPANVTIAVTKSLVV